MIFSDCHRFIAYSWNTNFSMTLNFVSFPSICLPCWLFFLKLLIFCLSFWILFSCVCGRLLCCASKATQTRQCIMKFSLPTGNPRNLKPSVVQFVSHCGEMELISLWKLICPFLPKKISWYLHFVLLNFYTMETWWGPWRLKEK